jgi:hypothetical protein
MMLAALLVAVIGFEHYSHSETSTLPLFSHPRSASLVEKSRTLPVQDIGGSIRTILGRPLFQMDRRPSPEAGSARIEPGVGRLTAILVSRTGKTLIFASVQGGKPIVVPEGGSIGPDIVQSISPGQATLLGPDGVKTIQPSFDVRQTATNPEPAVGRMATVTKQESRISKHQRE